MKKICFVVLTLFIGALVINSCSSDDGAVSESCPKITNWNFSVNSTSINFSFSGVQQANSYKVEYGQTGFSAGTGTSVTTSQGYIFIENLTPATTYDLIVTSICSATESSSPVRISSITTGASQCTGAPSLSFYPTTGGVSVNCSYSGSSTNGYQIEYGIAGFTPGSGTVVTIPSGSSSTVITNVQANVMYDYYVRAVCYQTDLSVAVKFQYTLDACPMPFNLNSYNLSGSCNVGLGETRGFSWNYQGSPTSYTISIVSASGVGNPSGGNQFTTSNQSIALSGMYCTWDAFYVRANCSNGFTSAWAGPFYF